MAKGKGEAYDLYVAETEPTEPSTATGYNLVGFALDQNFNASRDLIEAADKETGGDQEYIPGRRSQTIEGTFHLDSSYQNDAGQNVLWKNSQGSTTEQEIYFLLTGKSGDQQFRGKGLVEELDITFPDQDMIEISLTMQIEDGFVREAAA